MWWQEILVKVIEIALETSGEMRGGPNVGNSFLL